MNFLCKKSKEIVGRISFIEILPTILQNKMLIRRNK